MVEGILQARHGLGHPRFRPMDEGQAMVVFFVLFVFMLLAQACKAFLISRGAR